MMIENRLIVVASGPKTQTINVCTADNQPGLYETTFRLGQGAKRMSKASLKSITSLRELEQVLTREYGAKLENFQTWSAEWKQARKARDVSRVIALWKSRTAKDWQRTAWSGQLQKYRHTHLNHDTGRGEKEIESQLFGEPVTIRYNARATAFMAKLLYHQFPLANKREGQVISDALAAVEFPDGVTRPVMIEIKTTANDPWYALIECLQQVRMGRAYSKLGERVTQQNLDDGVWGLIVAPSSFYTKYTSMLADCRELLAALKKSTHARIAFATSDRLKEFRELELREEQNWF